MSLPPGPGTCPRCGGQHDETYDCSADLEDLEAERHAKRHNDQARALDEDIEVIT